MIIAASGAPCLFSCRTFHFARSQTFPVYPEAQLQSMLTSMPTDHNPRSIIAQIQRDQTVSDGEAEELMIELLERLLCAVDKCP
jgi:hypothetical protein